MDNEMDDLRINSPGFRALSGALAAIPIPRVFKERVVRGRETIIREQVQFSDVTFAELLSIMEEIEPAHTGHQEQLVTALATIGLIGIVAVDRSAAGDRSFERMRVSVTSEPAGYLLHSLSRFLIYAPLDRSPIRPDSSIKGLRVVLETALERNELNPHLLLAILLERGRENAEEDPLRNVRVISVLIKGEREKPNSSKQKEAVYLHVRKPDWDSYALVGSVQSEGEEDEETAQLALEEDLENAINLLDLRPSGVKDEYDVELSLTHGSMTLYAFNLFIVEAINGELRLREDMEYAWFTFEEICDQESRLGQPIITKANLLRRIDEEHGLDSIPSVVKDSHLFEPRSVWLQSRNVVRELSDLFKEFRELVQLVWMRLLSVKWWILLLLVAAGSLIVLRPIITQNIPVLSNIADILGIIGFILSLVGLWSELQKHRKRYSK